MSENFVFVQSENGVFLESENHARGSGGPPVIDPAKWLEVLHTTARYNPPDDTFNKNQSRQTTFFKKVADPAPTNEVWIARQSWEVLQTQVAPNAWRSFVDYQQLTGVQMLQAKDIAEQRGGVFQTYTSDAFYALPPWNGGDPREYPVLMINVNQLASAVYPWTIFGSSPVSTPSIWGLSFAPMQVRQFAGPNLFRANETTDNYLELVNDPVLDAQWIGLGYNETFRTDVSDFSFPPKSPTIPLVGGGNVNTDNLETFLAFYNNYANPANVATLVAGVTDEVVNSTTVDATGAIDGLYVALGGNWYWSGASSSGQNQYYHPNTFDPNAYDALRFEYAFAGP